MYKGLTVAVVVPAYNEEKLIARTITTMPALVDRIFVVDDASTDATAERVRDVGDDRVELVTHARNTGVGGAILDGHKRAIETGADVSVVMAGDAQMDPARLPDLLDPIAEDGCEFTKANRFFDFGSYEGMPKARIAGNILVSFLAKMATGYWHLFDPLNGYTATRSTALQRLPLDDIAQDYSFEVDYLVRLNILSVRARDLPVPAVYGEEVSRIKLPRASVGLVWEMFKGFWRRMLWKYVLFSFSPVAIFFFPGLFLLLFGLGWGIWAVVQTIGPPIATTGTILLAVAPALVGINLLIMAVLLDVLDSPR